jgi:DNA mismatch repair protein MutL
LLGAAFAAQALEMEVEASGMTLSGWVGAPGAARAHSDLQYLFINRRAVRDSTARHAVRQAFGERLASGRHPAYVLFLDLDPSQVDVNVHPAKSEVRFRESRLVHDFLWRGLSRALDAGLELPADPGAGATSVAAALCAGADAAPAAGHDAPAGDLRVADRGAAYGVRPGPGAALPWGGAGPSPGIAPGAKQSLVAGRYAVSVDGEGVTMADLARTRRLMIRRQLVSGCHGGSGVCRPLLLPLQRSVAEALADRLESRLGAISAAGFDLRRGAPGSITLRAVPACLAHVPGEVLLDTVLQWAEGKWDPATETLADALADVGGEQLRDLADDPQQVSALLRCAEAGPDGDKARLVTRLDAAAIAELMKR